MKQLLVWFGALLIFTLVMTAIMRAEEPSQKFYWPSVIVFAGGNALDAHSSWGQRELNPYAASANGRYGAKGLSIKIAYTAGMMAMEQVIIHVLPKGKARNKARGVFTKFNFVAGGGFSGIAVRNYIVRTR